MRKRVAEACRVGSGPGAPADVKAGTRLLYSLEFGLLQFNGEPALRRRPAALCRGGGRVTAVTAGVIALRIRRLHAANSTGLPNAAVLLRRRDRGPQSIRELSRVLSVLTTEEHDLTPNMSAGLAGGAGNSGTSKNAGRDHNNRHEGVTSQRRPLAELERWLQARVYRRPAASSIAMLDGYAATVVAGPVSMGPFDWICPLLFIDAHASTMAAPRSSPRCPPSRCATTRSATPSRPPPIGSSRSTGVTPAATGGQSRHIAGRGTHIEIVFAPGRSKDDEGKESALLERRVAFCCSRAHQSDHARSELKISIDAHSGSL